MHVAQWMTKDPLTIGSKESIVLARTILRERRIRRLPVVDGDHLVGIVTDRDLREAWASDANTLSTHELSYLLEKIPVREVMSSPVITVSPGTPLEGAVDVLRRKRIGGLPVVDGDRLVGILTETDVFRAFTRVLESGNVEGRPERPVRPAPPAGKLLVPVLGTLLSRKAVHQATELAARFGLGMRVLLVIDGGVDLEELRMPGDTRALDEIVAGLLTEYRSIAEEQKVPVETDFRSGDPATIALEEIAEGDYDFIVVGRHRPLHLGSSRLELEKVGFAARLLESSPVPVLVVGEAVHDRI